MIAPKFGPTLRMGVGSTAGVMADGSPAAEGGPAVAKCQKTAGGKVPQVSLNLDGVRRGTNPPCLATAMATAGAKGPEVIPLDNDDKFSNEGTSLMTSRPRKVGHTTPGKAAKLFVEAPSAKARDFAVKGVPTPAPLTMDDDDAWVGDMVSNAVSKPRSTAAARAQRHSPTTSLLAAESYDASAAMMPAPRRQQWQRRQSDVHNDASAVTATMPKRRQGNGRNDASAAMRPAPRQQ